MRIQELFFSLSQLGLGTILLVLFLLFVIIFILFYRPKSLRPKARSAEKNQNVRFSPGALEKMRRFNLNEDDVLDAFLNGERKTSRQGREIMVRKFSQYQIVVGFEKQGERWNIYSVGKYF